MFIRLSKGKGAVSLVTTKRHTSRRREMLSQMTQRTLGTSSLKEAVQLPEGEDKFEWLATNTVDFFNELSVLYDLVSNQAQEKYPKPGDGFPSGFEYRWVERQGNKSVRVSAPEYVVYVLSWIEGQMDDPRIFPVNDSEPFPAYFDTMYIKDIFKRMFRVFAIIYHSHFEKIQELDAAAHLNTCFKHFIFFSLEFNLLEDRETKVMRVHVENFRAEYENKSRPFTSLPIYRAADLQPTLGTRTSRHVKPGDGSTPTPQAQTRFFVSYHNRDAAGECLFLHPALCVSLGVKESDGFLDSNDLTDLTLLLQHIQSTLVLVLIQTAEVLCRPWVLLELFTAIKHKIPIVCVLLEGKGYDHAKAKKMLSSKEEFEAALGESAIADLLKHGYSPESIREELERVIPFKISFKFDSSCALETRQGMVRDISKEIQKHSAGYATLITKHELMRPVSSNDRKFTGHTDTIYAVACSPNSRMMASSSADKTVRLWDITGRMKCEVLTHHSTHFNSLAFFPLGTVGIVLAGGSKDGKVWVWNASTRVVMTVLTADPPVGAVCFSPDGLYLACASGDTLRFWSKSGWGLKKMIRQAHAGSIDAICFSPDSKRFLSGGKDGTVKVWSMDTFQLIRSLPGHSKGVTAVAFAPNSKVFASASLDHAVIVWDSATLSQITHMTFLDECRGIAFSPSSKVIAIAVADKTIRSAVACDEGDKYVEDVILTKHARLTRCVAYSPSSRYLISGGADNLVHVLDLEDD